MHIAYLVITILFSAMVAFSAAVKVRRDPKVVHVIHEVVGIPLQYFPALAACELAGSLGLILGIWLPSVALAAAVGLVIYFVGAVVSHVRVGDINGIGPAVFMLLVAAAALALHVLTHTPDYISL